MSTFLSIKANNWRNHFFNDPNKDATNRALTKIRAISEIDETDDSKAVFSRFSKSKDVTILFLSSNKKTLQLFHHPEILGGSVTSPTVTFAALSGFNEEATPIEIDRSSMMSINANTPAYNHFKETLKQHDEFVVLEEDGNPFKHANVIGLPPTLTEAFLACPDKDPTSIAMAFMTTMAAHDESMPTNDTANDNREHGPKMETEFTHVIQFCWLAANQQIHPITYSISQDNKTLKWSRDLHELHIQPRQTNAPQDSLPNKDHQVIYTLMSLKQSLDSERLSRQEKDDAKKPGISSFPAHIQNLIKNASATHPFEIAADEPTEFFKQFSSEKTVTKARLFLLHRLKRDKIAFDPSQGLVTAIHLGQLLWDSPDFPSNLSIFLCERALPKSFGTNQSKQLHLKSTEGLGLNDSDIPKITKQSIKVPKTYFEGISMIQNYYALLSLLFGEMSASAMGIRTCVTHILEHSAIYEARQHNDPTYLTQVLYDIDSRVQIHLSSCEDKSNREDVDDSVIDFSSSHRDILLGRFSYTIPDCLKLKTNNGIEEIGLKKRQQGGGGGFQDRTPIEKRIRNEKINERFKLRDNEPFAEVFHKNMKHVPKEKGQQLCLRFFIKGWCVSDCPRCHSLSAESEKELEKFIRTCRHNHNNPKNVLDF